MVHYLRPVIAAIVLMIATPVLAQPATPSTSSEAAIEAACKADMQHYCANVKPGSGGMGPCLKSNAKELSTGCKQALESAQRTK